MAATSTSEVPVNSTEGPVLSFINKRIRALRKKQNRIVQMEESLSQGKTLNKEQQETLRSKPGVVALIDELEKLRAPLSVAVEEEVSLALQSHQGKPSSDLPSAGGSGDTTASESAAAEVVDVAAPTVSGGHREGGGSVEDLLNLLYFGSLFDVMPQSDFTSMMLTRTHERGCCLTYDYVTDDATDLLGERDLDLIAALKGLVISRPLSESLSHKNALQRCIDHAKLWLAKSDQPIAPETSVTYAALREKLSKILSSDYYTTTPEMRGSVEMAAAAGVASFGSFPVPIHGSVIGVSMPGQAEDSTGKYQEEQNVNHEEYEASGEHQSVPVEEFQKHNPEVENKTEEFSYEAEQEITQAEVEQQNRELDPKDQPQYGGGPRRPYQNNRGGGGGRRGYSNGRGGRGSGRGGGQYQNGRGSGGQYYDQGGNYYPRNNNSNYRGRGGGGRGGSSHYNYNQSSGMQGNGAYTQSNAGSAS
ncbi:hypothetical protein V2J09_013026 [Rumex salicifolius]